MNYAYILLYNLDEPWKYYDTGKKLNPWKSHIAWFHLYEILRIGKSTETEHRLVVVRS